MKYFLTQFPAAVLGAALIGLAISGLLAVFLFPPGSDEHFISVLMWVGLAVFGGVFLAWSREMIWNVNA